MADIDKKDDTTNPELFKDLGINPDELPDALKPLYKSMQADYTKKTQTLAELRKEWTQKEDAYQQKLQNLGALEQETTQWREWYKSLEDQVGGDDKAAQLAKDEDLRKKLAEGDVGASAEVIRRLEGEIVALKDKVTTVEKSAGDVPRRVDRMFNYQAQLTDLVRENPKVDRNKILDHAVKTGQTDLKRVYQELYHDDIVAAEVTKRVNEELAKIRTDGIHSSSRPIIVRRSEKPMTYEEATESILKERAHAGKLE